MKKGLALTFLVLFSVTAHADCNPRKVARHAAMQTTVGASAHCMKNGPKDAVNKANDHAKNGVHR